MHPKLVEELRPWFEGRDPAGPLWPGRWAENKPAGIMMKRDLETDRIVYRDARCLVADFHSLRPTFIINLSRAGVSPKVIQFLARHSTITLTVDRYTHVELGDQAAALVGLPFFPATNASSPGVELEGVASSDTAASLTCTNRWRRLSRVGSG